MRLIPKENGLIDFGLKSSGALDIENGLTSVVLVSLFTDRRAKPDDEIPDARAGQHAITIDKRGWAGDTLNENGDRIGSRLWLLQREKQTEETRRKAIEYAKEALNHLIADNIVSDVTVDAEWEGIGRLNMVITLIKNDGETAIVQLTDIFGGVYAV